VLPQELLHAICWQLWHADPASIASLCLASKACRWMCRSFVAAGPLRQISRLPRVIRYCLSDRTFRSGNHRTHYTVYHPDLILVVSDGLLSAEIDCTLNNINGVDYHYASAMTPYTRHGHSLVRFQASQPHIDLQLGTADEEMLWVNHQPIDVTAMAQRPGLHDFVVRGQTHAIPWCSDRSRLGRLLRRHLAIVRRVLSKHYPQPGASDYFWHQSFDGRDRPHDHEEDTLDQLAGIPLPDREEQELVRLVHQSSKRRRPLSYTADQA
jgi:hypothetical protein